MKLSPRIDVPRLEPKYRCEIELRESGHYCAVVTAPNGDSNVIVEETRNEVLEAARKWVHWHRDRPEPEVFEL